MDKVKTMQKFITIALLLIASLPFFNALSQGELAATLEVNTSGVTVQRVNTNNPIAVQREAIVGVGDIIRTDATGQARIIFFADGTETDLLPNTEYTIRQFEGNDAQFQLSVEIISGQTIQRLNRLVDASSRYDVQTPGMELVARGTEFRVRVEADGRSAMLVDKGLVDAVQEEDAQVDPGFGIRAEAGSGLSEVVLAASFDQLDAALDGCPVTITTTDDVQLNVRLGPQLSFPRIGTTAPTDLANFIGVTESGGWYRIDFRDGYGWVLASKVEVAANCAGLRVFPDDHGPEDASLFTSLGEEISLDEIPTPAPEAEATEAPDTNEGE